MAERPRPVWVLLFTHVRHLASIVRDGIVCDAAAHTHERLTVEVGHADIKARRRRREVPTAPGGVVSDYVPFYFAPRSPMLSAIHGGGVPTYSGGEAGLVYLCTTLERLSDLGATWTATDRNAALATASFTQDEEALGGHIDWPLMGERYWANTDDDPTRRERRMAELLVHGVVPWAAITFIATRSDDDLAQVDDVLKPLDTVGGHCPRRAVRPDWYFCTP